MFKAIKRKIRSRIALIQDRLFGLGDSIYFKVEEVKISLKTSALEKRINKEIALLGEMIFETRDKNLSRIIKNESISKSAAHIINNQERLSGIKRQNLKRITKPDAPVGKEE